MKWQNQNVFPLLIINASGTFTGLFVYSPAPGAGNLVDSVAAAAGTDPYSNAYLAGMVNYFQVSPTSFLAVQTYQGQVTFYTATSAGGPWIAVGEIQILSDGIKLIGTGEIQLNVGLTLLTMNVNRLLASSAMEFTGIATPAAPAAGNFGLHSDLNGFPRFLSGLAGDTNVYEVGALHLFARNTAQLVNSTTPATITGLSCPVGIGTYRIRARILCTQNVAAVVQNFRFSGPAIVAGGGRVVAYSLANNASVGMTQVNDIGNSFLTTGVAFANGATWVTEIDGWYQFSAAGTLALQAAEGTATDTFTVADATLDVEPAI